MSPLVVRTLTVILGTDAAADPCIVVGSERARRLLLTLLSQMALIDMAERGKVTMSWGGASPIKCSVEIHSTEREIGVASA